MLLFPIGPLVWLWARPRLKKGKVTGYADRELVWRPYEGYWAWHDTLYPGGSSRSGEWRALAQEAKERDRWRCVVCGAEEDLQTDHIVPLSAGGPNDLTNLQTLCRACHETKTGRRIPGGVRQL